LPSDSRISISHQGRIIFYVRVSYRKLEKATLPIHKENNVRQWTGMKLNKIDEKVVATLQAEGKELTLQEISDKSGEPSKKVFRSLRKLFENEIISTQARKYKLVITDSKAIKAKLAAKGEEKEPEV